MMLRGCFLRNTDYAVGLVIYVGKESKIMKNAKKGKKKVSNMMILMNYMLYTVFLFQFLLIVAFSSVSMIWQKNNAASHIYLNKRANIGALDWFT